MPIKLNIYSGTITELQYTLPSNFVFQEKIGYNNRLVLEGHSTKWKAMLVYISIAEITNLNEEEIDKIRKSLLLTAIEELKKLIELGVQL